MSEFERKRRFPDHSSVLDGTQIAPAVGADFCGDYDAATLDDAVTLITASASAQAYRIAERRKLLIDPAEESMVRMRRVGPAPRYGPSQPLPVHPDALLTPNPEPFRLGKFFLLKCMERKGRTRGA